MMAVWLARLSWVAIACSPAPEPPPEAQTPRAADESTAGPDGPYVWMGRDGGWTVKRIVGGARGPELLVEERRADENELKLELEGRPFTVRLRPNAPPPACEHAKTDTVLALSDVEGNLPALIALLRAASAVDERLDWTFGDGRVVFVGDLFDRGLQVTECLWLLYELEARAQAKGGGVHFVLGNHEVMNLTGDLRYVREKYRANAALLGVRLEDVYSRDTVLGRWLRTRNVAERIGDELFVHGGIRPEIAAAKPRLVELSNALRDALLAEAWTKPKEGLLAFAAGSEGLTWYRGYVKEPAATAEEVDRVLAAFGAKRIVVGHTLVPRVDFAIGRRVLTIDVHHASGASQAALFVDGAWHRLHPSGKREKL